MFFSLMQGHIGAHASVLDAMKYVFGEVVGSGRINPNVMRKKLKEYSDEGIIDSSVVAGEVEALHRAAIAGLRVDRILTLRCQRRCGSHRKRKQPVFTVIDKTGVRPIVAVGIITSSGIAVKVA